MFPHLPLKLLTSYTMKKTISILLVIMLVFTFVTPFEAFGAGKGKSPKLQYATREDVAHFFASNYDFAAIRQNYISDIQDCVYKDDILEMYEAGIMNLYEDGTSFGPNDYITRLQYAIIFVRVAEALNIDLSEFDTLPQGTILPDRCMNILINMGIYKLDKSCEVYPDEYLTQNYLTQKYIELINSYK